MVTLAVLAARTGRENIHRQEKAKAATERDLVLAKKSEHGRLDGQPPLEWLTMPA